MKTTGYLGIDLGTQGLSVIFVDAEMQVLASGEAGYDMVSDLPDGCYEQVPADWERAVADGARRLLAELGQQEIQPDVQAIGISGQMHGEVIAPDPRTARLWCDGRNEAEAAELTDLLGVKMPKRMTAARWLWTLRHRIREGAQTDRRRVEKLTTPGGWLAYLLTGEFNLGIGDASGVFPISQETRDYNNDLIERYNRHVMAQVDSPWAKDLRQLLPTVRLAGEDGGCLTERGARLLGLPAGIPVAPAEGDQPAALAGSLIGSAGTVSMSFGTSVCANSVGDRPFRGVCAAVDHFCAADGKPINMVMLRNGTTFMNSIVEALGAATSQNRSESFDAVMPLLLEAPPGCEGISALPFLDDEPGLDVSHGSLGTLSGLNAANCKPGNLAKAALLATVFNLKIGCDILREQGYPLTEIMLSGGLTRTPALGQVIADVFRAPVRILKSAAEGSAWGAAWLARYRHQRLSGSTCDWSDFLKGFQQGNETCFTPNSDAAEPYETSYRRHRQLIQLTDSLMLGSS